MSELATMRTDVVGSLLRPDGLKQARRRFDTGELDADGLREVEDAAIREAVALQEGAGLGVVTDGEFRRLNFQDSFGACVDGFRSGSARMEILERQSHGGTALRRWDVQRDVDPQVPVWHRLPAVERLRLARNLPLEEYRFLGAATGTPAKVALVGPDRISQRFDHENSRGVYPTMDDFLADVVAIEKAMVASLVEAGCRYVQIDAPGYTAYVDEPSVAAMRARGEDPEANLERSIAADNRIVEAFGDAVSGIHLCRGNQRSMWHREGSYDAVAERLFSGLRHRRLLLEYDTERAGGFEPLRFVPKGTVVVLGLVSTKVPELESVDFLKRRIDDAARYLPLEQLAISPQCGFSSDVVGNLITPDDQKRKLERVVETARQVWG
ncbi:MAG: methionine synthase [Deltaproteobacteria bacterium]|nr:methionine synthase [Deltaproteobacteria bacterium]